MRRVQLTSSPSRAAIPSSRFSRSSSYHAWTSPQQPTPAGPAGIHCQEFADPAFGPQPDHHRHNRVGQPKPVVAHADTRQLSRCHRWRLDRPCLVELGIRTPPDGGNSMPVFVSMGRYTESTVKGNVGEARGLDRRGAPAGRAGRRQDTRLLHALGPAGSACARCTIWNRQMRKRARSGRSCGWSEALQAVSATGECDAAFQNARHNAGWPIASPRSPSATGPSTGIFDVE